MESRLLTSIGIGLLVVAFLAGRALWGKPASPAGRVGAPDNSLFVEVDAAAKARLLDDWRWKVGPEATVLRVTVFGDLFTQTPDGHIHWLDTAWGKYSEVAASATQWKAALQSHRSEWFHGETLRELRRLKVELGPGQVFSWSEFPMVGGKEAAGNVGFVSAEVHVSFAGRLAEAIKDVPPGEPVHVEFTPLGPAGPVDDKNAQFTVVIDAELQYSIWPAGEAIPPGWKSAGKTGTQRECLEYIKRVWTDQRPLSLRKKMDAEPPKRR